MAAPQYALIIPALNEAESLKRLLPELPRARLMEIIVADNGSRDGTAEVARAAGARVIAEPRRGYGQACQAGLAALAPSVEAVIFMDGDLSGDLADLDRLLDMFDSGGWDLIIGSRTLGEAEPGALTPLQRTGNWLTTRLIRWNWGMPYTDLGPLRVVRREVLERMKLRDTNFGWNVEMQAKAAALGVRVAEIPVRSRRRKYGKSKISGTVTGAFRAGVKILATLAQCWWWSRHEKGLPRA